MKPRLIDANELFEKLGEAYGIPDDWDGGIDEACEIAFDLVQNAPTAYDVDAVVERLEEERDRPFADCDLTINGRPANDREIVACKVGIKYAIEIVKGGAE